MLKLFNLPHSSKNQSPPFTSKVEFAYIEMTLFTLHCLCHGELNIYLLNLYHLNKHGMCITPKPTLPGDEFRIFG